MYIVMHYTCIDVCVCICVQRKLPVYSVGVGMRDAGTQLCAEDPKSLFG